MRGVAATRLSPGAETCIVVGDVAGADQLDLRGYRSVLWFTRGHHLSPARFAGDAAHICVEPIEPADPARTAASLESLIRRDARHLPSVFVTDEANGDAAPSFLPVIETIVAQFESHQRARTTRQQDGLVWQRHLLTNLPHYAQRRVPGTWANALRGLPAIICGAGPSLDASITQLARDADRAVIFAADSALRALARAGVTADFAFSVDAGKTPAKCLPPGVPAPGRIVVAGISPPEWQSAIDVAKIFFLSGRQVTEDWLATLGLARTTIGVEENCGITALTLAQHLGCGPIFLFGMDHAVDSQNPTRWHEHNGAAMFDRQIGFQAEHHYPKVPGNYQAEIATPLLREWRALDAKCAASSEGSLFNVTDRGARLRNTTLVAPAAFAIAEGACDKTARLVQLTGPPPIESSISERVLKKVHATADCAATPLATARAALGRGDLSRAIQALALAFRDPDIGRLFGNYALKIMPHLLRPGETDRTHWRQLLDECDELISVVRETR